MLLPDSPRFRAWREILLAIGVLFILGYAWMPTAGVSSPNERSRIYLAVSLVDHHTLSIDSPIARFGNIYDLARFQGHFYTDKAPGTSVLAAAVYGVCRLFVPASSLSIEDLLSLMRRTIMLPFGVLGFLLFRRLARQLSLREPSIDLVSLAWILGSAAAHTSAALMGHQIVSVCLLAGLQLLLLAEQRSAKSSERSTGWLCCATGLIAGFAVFTEYQSAIPFGLLGLFFLAGPLGRRPKPLVLFVLGALPGALGLLIYNKLAFGSAFDVSYHHLVSPELQQIHNQGIGGVSVPRLAYARGALLSWHRGVFSTSPFFLCALPGLVVMWRQGRRRLALLIGVAFAYYILFLSSTKIWYAGWGFGPRLMVPGFGWVALAATFGVSSLRSWLTKGVALGLCLWSILLYQTVNLVFPEMPERFTNPLLDVAWPALRSGIFVPNLATRLAGWKGLPSLLPVLLVLSALLSWLILNWTSTLSDRVRRGLLLLVGGATLTTFVLLVRFTAPTCPPASTQAHLRWMGELLDQEKAAWKK